MQSLVVNSTIVITLLTSLILAVYAPLAPHAAETAAIVPDSQTLGYDDLAQSKYSSAPPVEVAYLHQNHEVPHYHEEEEYEIVNQ